MIDTEHKRPHLSHSAVKLFTQCGERYRLEKVARVPSAPSDALAKGVAVHEALQTFVEALRDGAVPPTQDDLVDTFKDALQRELKARDPHDLFARAEIAEMRETGYHLVQQFYTRVARAWAVEHADGDAVVDAVEEAFTLPIYEYGVGTAYPEPRDTGWDFTGRIDVRRRLRHRSLPDERQYSIEDFKTASKPWLPGAQHKDGQATAYAWAEFVRAGQLPGRVTFHVVNVSLTGAPGSNLGESGGHKRLPNVGYNALTTTRTLAEVGMYQRRLLPVIAAIQSGQYTPNPGPLCAWCGVSAHCPTGLRWLDNQTKFKLTPVVERFNATPAALRVR